MEIQEQLSRAIKAREVLENELYIESFELVRQEIIDQWENSPARDSQARETMFLMLKITNKLKAVMQSAMESGKIAELNLKHQETMAQKAKRLLSADW